MGNLISSLLSSLSSISHKRIIMLGLDAAGKTTILYKLNLGETVYTVPTVGFNVETIKYKNISFDCWDIGGQNKIRVLWKHYYHGTHAIIFVVDANDPSRIDEAKEELYRVLSDDILSDAALLVFANKIDLPHGLSVSEVADKLELQTKMTRRQWHIQGSIGVSGQGLYDGLDWLCAALKK